MTSSIGFIPFFSRTFFRALHVIKGFVACIDFVPKSCTIYISSTKTRSIDDGMNILYITQVHHNELGKLLFRVTIGLTSRSSLPIRVPIRVYIAIFQVFSPTL